MRAIAAFFAGAAVAAGIYWLVEHRGSRPVPAPKAAPVEAPAAMPAAPAPVIPAAPEQKPEPRPLVKPKPRKAPIAATQSAPHVTPEQPAGEPKGVAATPPAASSPPASAPPVAPAPEPALARQPHQVTLPAGALITVRLSERLSSDRNAPGDAFTATLDEPLVVDGFVIAERGARVEGKVVAIQEAGRVKGVATLALQLVRLTTSDGQLVEISTDPFEKKASSEKIEDAAKVGAAAAIGAAIGAIAGGGKGAAIGAGVGGAAGGGTVLATRGKPAALAPETRITFRLNSPVTIVEKL